MEREDHIRIQEDAISAALLENGISPALAINALLFLVSSIATYAQQKNLDLGEELFCNPQVKMAAELHMKFGAKLKEKYEEAAKLSSESIEEDKT